MREMTTTRRRFFRGAIVEHEDNEMMRPFEVKVAG